MYIFSFLYYQVIYLFKTIAFVKRGKTARKDGISQEMVKCLRERNGNASIPNEPDMEKG